MKESIVGIIMLSISVGILLAMLIPDDIWTYVCVVFFIIFGISVLRR